VAKKSNILHDHALILQQSSYESFQYPLEICTVIIQVSDNLVEQ